MTMLVTVEEARTHLQVDTYAHDPWIEMAIEAVSDAVLGWLKDSWRAYTPSMGTDGNPIVDDDGNEIPAADTSGNFFVRPRVKMAVLVEIGQQFRFRDGSGAAAVPQHWGHGYVLGAGATSLLSSLRRSTIA